MRTARRFAGTPRRDLMPLAYTIADPPRERGQNASMSGSDRFMTPSLTHHDPTTKKREEQPNGRYQAKGPGIILISITSLLAHSHMALFRRYSIQHLQHRRSRNMIPTTKTESCFLDFFQQGEESNLFSAAFVSLQLIVRCRMLSWERRFYWGLESLSSRSVGGSIILQQYRYISTSCYLSIYIALYYLIISQP